MHWLLILSTLLVLAASAIPSANVVVCVHSATDHSEVVGHHDAIKMIHEKKASFGHCPHENKVNWEPTDVDCFDVERGACASPMCIMQSVPCCADGHSKTHIKDCKKGKMTCVGVYNLTKCTAPDPVELTESDNPPKVEIDPTCTITDAEGNAPGSVCTRIVSGIPMIGVRICSPDQKFLICDRLHPTFDSETGDLCWNGRDDDGNGLIDCEDPACIGATTACFTGPANLTFGGRSICKAGVMTCHGFGNVSKCEGEVLPEKERCNNRDDNCNGIADEFPDDCIDGAQTCVKGQCVGCSAQHHTVRFLDILSDVMRNRMEQFRPYEASGDVKGMARGALHLYFTSEKHAVIPGTFVERIGLYYSKGEGKNLQVTHYDFEYSPDISGRCRTEIPMKLLVGFEEELRPSGDKLSTALEHTNVVWSVQDSRCAGIICRDTVL